MGSFSHVNNFVHFGCFNSARIQYFQRVRFLGERKNYNVGSILTSTSCRFRRPNNFPDELLVSTRVRDWGMDRFKMNCLILNLADEIMVAANDGLIVSYDYRKKKKALILILVRNGIKKLEPGHQ